MFWCLTPPPILPRSTVHTVFVMHIPPSHEGCSRQLLNSDGEKKEKKNAVFHRSESLFPVINTTARNVAPRNNTHPPCFESWEKGGTNWWGDTVCLMKVLQNYLKITRGLRAIEQSGHCLTEAINDTTSTVLARLLNHRQSRLFLQH